MPETEPDMPNLEKATAAAPSPLDQRANLIAALAKRGVTDVDVNELLARMTSSPAEHKHARAALHNRLETR